MLSAMEISPSISCLLQGLGHDPVWQNPHHWQYGSSHCQATSLCLQIFLEFCMDPLTLAGLETWIPAFLPLDWNLNGLHPGQAMVLLWKWIQESHGMLSFWVCWPSCKRSRDESHVPCITENQWDRCSCIPWSAGIACQLVLWHCNWTFFNTSTNM